MIRKLWRKLFPVKVRWKHVYQRPLTEKRVNAAVAEGYDTPLFVAVNQVIDDQLSEIVQDLADTGKGDRWHSMQGAKVEAIAELKSNIMSRVEAGKQVLKEEEGE